MHPNNLLGVKILNASSADGFDERKNSSMSATDLIYVVEKEIISIIDWLDEFVVEKQTK